MSCPPLFQAGIDAGNQQGQKINRTWAARSEPPRQSALCSSALCLGARGRLGPITDVPFPPDPANAAYRLAFTPEPRVPVFLIHGRSDRVIPADESQRLAGRVRGRVPVRLLLTDLISHAEADQPAQVGDVLRLAGFWGDPLAQ